MPFITNFFWATFFVLLFPHEFSTGACPTPSGQEFDKTHHCALCKPRVIFTSLIKSDVNSQLCFSWPDFGWGNFSISFKSKFNLNGIDKLLLQLNQIITVNHWIYEFCTSNSYNYILTYTIWNPNAKFLSFLINWRINA